MTIPDFNFQVHENGTFEVPEEGIQIRLNIEESSLEVLSHNAVRASFSLSENELPLEQALFLDDETVSFQVGKVNFGTEPLFLREYPVNTGEISFEFRIRRGGGFIGSVDIRYVFRQLDIHYDFSQVPIQLSRTGNFLRITTIRCGDQGTGGCWYSEKPIN